MYVELTDAVLYYGFEWGSGPTKSVGRHDYNDIERFISYIDWTYRHRMWTGLGRLQPLTFYRPTHVNLNCIVT